MDDVANVNAEGLFRPSRPDFIETADMMLAAILRTAIVPAF